MKSIQKLDCFIESEMFVAWILGSLWFVKID